MKAIFIRPYNIVSPPICDMPNHLGGNFCPMAGDICLIRHRTVSGPQ